MRARNKEPMAAEGGRSGLDLPRVFQIEMSVDYQMAYHVASGTELLPLPTSQTNGQSTTDLVKSNSLESR